MSVQPLEEQLAATLRIDGNDDDGTRFSPPLVADSPTLALKSSDKPHFFRNALITESDSDEEESDLERNGQRRGTSAIDDSEDGGDSSPRFFPPLWLARRTFIFEQLKAQGIKSVADLGCGEGSLLSLLSIPAYHVDDFPSLYPPSSPALSSVPSSCVSDSSFAPSRSTPNRIVSSQEQSRGEKLAILRSVPRPDASHAELHLRKLVGIDADPNVCDVALEVVAPTPEPSSRKPGPKWIAPEFRFEELTTQVFCGHVEVFNESVEDCEAIVLTEVIEHMTPAALSKLPNLLFNVYSPRLVVVTTPNHSFNPYFSPPESPSSSKSRAPASTLYPDPTNRTSPRRVFRDPTHLFEFTPSEFETWCTDSLEKSGCADEYDVSFSGVGSLASYYAPSTEIPFPPPALSLHPALEHDKYSTTPVVDPRRFYSTQIAVFEKRFSNESERSPRSARPVPLPFFSPPSASSTIPLPLCDAPPLASPVSTTGGGNAECCFPVPHKLVGSHVHHAHPNSSLAQPRHVILEELGNLFAAHAERRRPGGQNGGRDEDKVGWMTLSEVWRVGGLPTSQEGGEMCLREMVGGEIAVLVNALLGGNHDNVEGDRGGAVVDDVEGRSSPTEWVFERVDHAQGLEGLRIGWTEWRGPTSSELGYNHDESTVLDEQGGRAQETGEELVFEGLREDATAEWNTAPQRQQDVDQEDAQIRSNGWSGTIGNPEMGGWNDEW
ncbi:hypothetical protein JCM3766R1_006635 [Sporobolomyces carnicolor]